MSIWPWRWNWLARQGRSPRGQKTLGELGEDEAARFLARRKHRIVARRHRTRYGELDLVTLHRSTIVFVEVKTRSHSYEGESPADAVDEAKQRQLTRAAAAYLRAKGLLGQRCRFDVVAIEWPDPDRRPDSIRHFVDAFESSDANSLF